MLTEIFGTEPQRADHLSSAAFAFAKASLVRVAGLAVIAPSARSERRASPGRFSREVREPCRNCRAISDIFSRSQ